MDTVGYVTYDCWLTKSVTHTAMQFVGLLPLDNGYNQLKHNDYTVNTVGNR